MSRQRLPLPLAARYRWLLAVMIVAIPGLAVAVQQLLGPAAGSAGLDALLSAAEPAGESSPKQLPRVRVEEVGHGSTDTLTTYPGTVKAVETVALAFRVGGPLIEVNVKPGDHVHHGDILMRIDPRDFENAASAAQATLDSAKAKLVAMKKGARVEDILVLEARIEAAVSRRKYLQAVFERNKRLLTNNAVSQTDYDSSETDLKTNDADIRALEQELSKAKAGARVEDIQAMEADIRGMETSLKIARDHLDDTYLRAPFDGIITKQLAENYEQVMQGQTVLAMHDLSTLEIDVALPEKEILHRPLDNPFSVAVRLMALPERSFQASFKEINTEADPATRTYVVTFAMQPPVDLNVFPGMIADVTLQSRANGMAKSQALRVPASAVQSDAAGTRFVWVVVGDTAHRRPITIGSLLAANCYEVLEGLSAGEQLVTAGAAFLHDGAAVRVTCVEGVKPHSTLTQANTTSALQ